MGWREGALQEDPGACSSGLRESGQPDQAVGDDTDGDECSYEAGNQLGLGRDEREEEEEDFPIVGCEISLCSSTVCSS